MNKTFWMAATGAFVGGLISSWFSPRVIGWYFEPPVNIGVNCREATEWAMARLQWAQFIGAVVGAVIALALYFFFRKRKI